MPNKYSFITNKKRALLIEKVVNQGEILSVVAKKMKIKLTTAKFIVKKFLKTGNILVKKGKYEKINETKEKKASQSLKCTQIEHQIECQIPQNHQYCKVEQAQQERIEAQIQTPTPNINPFFYAEYVNWINNCYYWNEFMKNIEISNNIVQNNQEIFE